MPTAEWQDVTLDACNIIGPPARPSSQGGVNSAPPQPMPNRDYHKLSGAAKTPNRIPPPSLHLGTAHTLITRSPRRCWLCGQSLDTWRVRCYAALSGLTTVLTSPNKSRKGRNTGLPPKQHRYGLHTAGTRAILADGTGDRPNLFEGSGPNP